MYEFSIVESSLPYVDYLTALKNRSKFCILLINRKG